MHHSRYLGQLFLILLRFLLDAVEFLGQEHYLLIGGSKALRFLQILVDPDQFYLLLKSSDELGLLLLEVVNFLAEFLNEMLVLAVGRLGLL